MALPSADTFITNVLIDLPRLFTFPEFHKAIGMMLETQQKYSTQTLHCNNIFCSHVSSVTLQCKKHLAVFHKNRMTWNLLHNSPPNKQKKKKKKKKYVCIFWSKQNSNHNDIDESQYHSALQSTVTSWAIIFTPYFLKADEASSTSSVANVYWRYSTWKWLPQAAPCILLGSTANNKK